MSDNRYVLALYDIRAKQNFIFRTNHIKEIIGASAIIRDCFKEPICDAVVKLTEVAYDCGKEIRKPIGHTFTDKEGEFVFGPLCPDRHYAIQIWANATKKIKICAKCHHEGKCLKGDKHDKCDCFIDDKKPWHRNESVEESKDDCCEE